MNNVNGVGASSFDWSTLVDKLNEAVPAAKAGDVTFSHDDKNLNVSVTRDGTTVNTTIEMPELETPGVIQAAELESLVAKLGDIKELNLTEAQLKDLSAVLSTLASMPAPSGNTVLFDLYALMLLMLEVAQQQRDAAREVRKSENEAVIASLEAQAAQQRSAANSALIATIAVTVVQATVQGISAGVQAHAAKVKSAAAEKIDLKGAEADLKQAHDLIDPKAAKLQDAKNIRALDADKTKAAETLTAKRTELTDAEAAAEADPTNKTLKADVKKLKSEVKTAEKNEAAATKKYNDAVENWKKDYGTDELLTNDQFNELSEEVDNLTGQQLVPAEQRLLDKQKMLSMDSEYSHATNVEAGARLVSDMASMIGNTAQAAIRNMNEMRMSQVTEEAADQKKSEEDFNLTVDLFNQTQSVIDKVLSLFAAVIQAENQSMRDTIQA